MKKSISLRNPRSAKPALGAGLWLQSCDACQPGFKVRGVALRAAELQTESVTLYEWRR